MRLLTPVRFLCILAVLGLPFSGQAHQKVNAFTGKFTAMMTFTDRRPPAAAQSDIVGALRVLRQGGLLLYPTDTVWSIGCDATDPDAVQRLLTLKRASELEALVDSPKMLRKHIDHLHPRLETLLAYHVRPLTVCYDDGQHLAEDLRRPDGKYAIRMVQDGYCQALIRAFGKPIVATSADLRPDAYPANFGAISSDVFEQVDFIVHHRRNDKSIAQPSVMVQLGHKDELEFLRE
ncbi:MAG: translation factor Sua5 [Bacteroidetes bacterium]|jgi:L-threonylcarbamoyladenylate synthase|nr:translation factor Sua5 [Bacteroidota bacterium]